MNIPDLKQGLPPCAGKKDCTGQAIIYLPARSGFVCSACLDLWRAAKSAAAEKLAQEAFQ